MALATASGIADTYARDGFVFPIDVVSEDEAKAVRADLEAAEAELAGDPEKLALLRSYPDRLLPSFDRLVRDNAYKFVDSFYPVEQRLCDYLHRLSVGNPVVAKTQAELAGLLGCARQTLNRELKHLRQQGIIELEKGKIRVIDRPTLGQLAENHQRAHS